MQTKQNLGVEGGVGNLAFAERPPGPIPGLFPLIKFHAELTRADFAKGVTAGAGAKPARDLASIQHGIQGETVSLVNTVLPAAQSGSTYNADNELTSFEGKAYSYDLDGNLTSDGTSTYTWNARGQLASVATPSGTSTLGYDPTGNLISTTVGGVTTTFAYQHAQLISQSTSGGASYAFLNGPTGTLSSTNTASGAVQAYLPDALNSTLALVNSAGNVQASYSYDLLGNAASSAGAPDPNPLRYTGIEDLTTVSDDVAGDGTGYDGLGEDACTSAAANSFAGTTPVTLADGTTTLGKSTAEPQHPWRPNGG